MSVTIANKLPLGEAVGWHCDCFVMGEACCWCRYMPSERVEPKNYRGCPT